MKARLPKSWDRLPPSEKLKIAEVKQQEIYAEQAKVQKIWLMLQCVVNHDYMGMSEEECLLALANWHEVYRLNQKHKTEEEQMAWLESKMRDIFKVNGYPYKYIDKLENM